MTAIVGIVQDGAVYLGGDSAAVGGDALDIRASPKVFVNGPTIIGYAGSFRIGQLLQYALDIPEPPEHESDLMRYMVTRFVNAVRNCLKDGGAASTDEDGETGDEFLVGVGGRLFKVCSDYQVAEGVDGYMACGLGGPVALGNLAATDGQEPGARIHDALVAAGRHTSCVRGPFHMVALHPANHYKRALDRAA